MCSERQDDRHRAAGEIPGPVPPERRTSDTDAVADTFAPRVVRNPAGRSDPAWQSARVNYDSSSASAARPPRVVTMQIHPSAAPPGARNAHRIRDQAMPVGRLQKNRATRPRRGRCPRWAAGPACTTRCPVENGQRGWDVPVGEPRRSSARIMSLFVLIPTSCDDSVWLSRNRRFATVAYDANVAVAATQFLGDSHQSPVGAVTSAPCGYPSRLCDRLVCWPGCACSVGWWSRVWCSRSRRGWGRCRGWLRTV